MEAGLEANEQAEWRAGELARRWLLFGIFAALVDGGLQGAGAALELRFWRHDGLTPETLVGLLAILPQIVLLIAFLNLAKDLGGRRLWKSAFGFYCCGWLGLLLNLTTYDALPRWLTMLISIAGGVGILAMVIFLFGKWPVFPSQSPVKQSDTADSPEQSPKGTGCLGQIIVVSILIALKLALRNHKRWFWWAPGDVEGWAFFEILFVLVLFIIFGFSFAVAKIKLRRKLGGMSALLGCTELLVGAIHLTMLAFGIGILTVTIVNHPEIDDAAIEKLFDSKAQLAIVVSGASSCVLSVVNMLFFASVRARSASTD